MDAATALGGIGLGAALAWLSSMYGARKEADREHARWLRERRFEAWSAFLNTCTTVASIPRHDLLPKPTNRALTNDELADIRDAMALCTQTAASIHEAAGRLDTLGPAGLTDRTRPILTEAGIVLLTDEDELDFQQVKAALRRMGALVEELRPLIRAHFE